jgi:hypothetical protein
MDPAQRYRNPRAPQPTRAHIDTGMDKVALGQKLVIYGILVNLITVAILFVPYRAYAPYVGVVALGISLSGIVLIGRGLGFTTGHIVGLLVLMLVPLANVVVLLIVNSQATQALRLAGYQVGLFGASK